MYNEQFLNNLPSDPYEAVKALSDEFLKEHSSTTEDVENYDRYLEAFAAMEAFIAATGLPFSIPKLEEQAGTENVQTIAWFFQGLNDSVAKKVHESTLNKKREKYAKMFGTTFMYQFSDGDLARIQQLLNELRDSITKSELFDAKHKQRILKKLENLQSELHKKMTSLDGFWGLIGDAGVALGKFGQDAKPLVDRIKEISQIAWRTQARAEELPSGTPLPLLSEGKKEDKQE